MNFTSVFKVANSVNAFIHDSMSPVGRVPAAVSVKIMLWRLSNTVVGAEIVNRYRLATGDEKLWRDTAAYMLQSLSGLFETVKLCAENRHKDGNRPSGRDRASLKDLAQDAAFKCRGNGCSADALFDYIVECRNIYVHSGIMPYVVESEGRRTGLNDFLRRKFGDDPVVAASLNVGSSLFRSAGDSRKFQALCNLILSAMCFYFDSLNRSLSNYAPVRYVGLYINVTVETVRRAVRAVVSAALYVFAGSMMLFKLLMAAFVVSVVAVIVLVVSSRIIGFFGSGEPQHITSVEPRELVRMVDQMTPYEQMSFLKGRRSALSACGIKHRAGDAVLSPADRNTELLYNAFKNCPDPTAHPLSFIPNASHLARKPFWGAAYSHQWGGEKLFSAADSSVSRERFDTMPVYSGHCYPLMMVGTRNVGSERFGGLARRLAVYPQLDVYVLYGETPDDRLLAEKVKQQLTIAGVRRGRINTVCDKTIRGGALLAVGGVSNYSVVR